MNVFLCAFKPQPFAQHKTFDAWEKIAKRSMIPLRFCLLAPVSVMGDIEIPVEWAGTIELIGMDGPLSEFQRGRRIAAECLATSDPYIVADDDCIPNTPNFIEQALVALTERENESFAVVASMPSNAMIMTWTPEEYSTLTTEDVMEHHNVGQIRFTRKGVLPKDAELWMPQPPETEWGWKYDAEHAAMIRDAGYRVGYFRNIFHRHLGERHPRKNIMVTTNAAGN